MIRPAQWGDRDAWQQIRNDPEMRFWSGSNREILTLEHALWFGRALTSPQHLLLVEEGNAEQVRGWARAEAQTAAVVSFAVQKEHRGQGIGTALLLELERRVLGMPITKLRALVHPSNIASIRAFFKAGYFPNRDNEGFIVLEKPIVRVE